ncbi:MAG: hypothetical protein SGILL_009987, partial [Bacillariaceae sp.]
MDCVNPALTIRALVHGLKVQCKNNLPDEDAAAARGDDGQKRDQSGDGTDDSGRRVRSRTTEGAEHKCEWTGRLDELQRHSEHHCQLATIQCDKQGCSTRVFRRELESHQNSAACITAVLRHEMKLEMNQALQRQAEKFEREMEKTKFEAIQLYLSTFCRKWLERKPDPLFDFVVYRDGNDQTLKRLLVGVPGPKRTPWEGGLYPMLMVWEASVNKPPRCRFPAGFLHPNVYPSGRISISTLYKDEGWHPEISIPEILFDVQQLLAHPNINSPAQAEAYSCYNSDKKDYNR